MATVTIDESGQIDLPEAILKESRIQPGSQLLILAGEGRITLIDKERLQQQLSGPMQQVLAQLQRSLTRDPQSPFFGGLTFEEYAALSEEEEQALWDRLSAEAHQEVKLVEQEIPPHFRPAGQERR
jgi:bifunctional DNA-binding transcriptional regulator/antitoxin component of YhaV-PrlF toxin-antitoxin module